MILLDTHIWVWLNGSSERLPAAVAQAAARGEPFAISSISIWETMPIIERGRIASVGPPEQMLRRWLVANPVDVIPVDTDISILARALSVPHLDSADRFIAATALHIGVPLATTDKNLLALPWLSHV